MIILAIDPGTTTSGVVLYATRARAVLWSESALPNDKILGLLRSTAIDFAASAMGLEGLAEALLRPEALLVAVERVQAQGMAGNDVMITCEWSARFTEAAESTGYDTRWHYRRDVCRHLHVGGAKKDPQVRARCIELHGGDRRTAQGTKKAPGPLYGVAGHAWQALGLALLVGDV